MQELPDPAAMARLAEPWRPFRSLGSYLMWKVEVARAPNGSGSKKAKKAKKA